MYREHRSDHHYDNLQGYVDDFIGFLGKEKILRDDRMQHAYLCSEIGTYYDKVKHKDWCSAE